MPTVVHSNGHSINNQTQLASTKRGYMEECLGVNARPVARVDCHLEERECESVVQFLIYMFVLYVLWQTFNFRDG